MLSPQKSFPESRAIGSDRKTIARIFSLALLLIATAVLYWKTLYYGLVLDDTRLIIRSPVLADLHHLRQIFFESAWQSVGTGSAYYRPLLLLPFAAIRTVFGSAPLPLHAFALVCYLASVAVAFYWLRIFLDSDVAAFAAAALFAFHPLHAETAAWVTDACEASSRASCWDLFYSPSAGGEPERNTGFGGRPPSFLPRCWSKRRPSCCLLIWAGITSCIYRKLQAVYAPEFFCLCARWFHCSRYSRCIRHCV